MLDRIALPTLERLLSTTAGWVELGIVLAAFVAGWLADRALMKRQAPPPAFLRLAGGVVRIAMPLAALALLFVARVAWNRYQPSPILDLGIVLALALAAIRMTVYTLRRLVPNVAWLKPWERTVSFVVWTIVALHVLGIAPEIAEELEAYKLPLGKGDTTLLTIVKGAAAVVVTIAVALWLSGLLEQRLMKTELDLSQRALASKFVRALLLVIGVLVALQAMGLDLTILSVFGGALGVGVGLGLQRLAANYISGYVILLDRSIRLGDLISVGDRHGIVTNVTSRYSVVRSLDGVEAIVPNETLVTTTVLNHSYSTKDVRVGLQVQVAYGTDLERALAILRDVAREHPRVEDEEGRRPNAFVVRFADSGIDLELGFWIRDPEAGQLGVKSELNLAIWKAFGAEGIAIPFPQREVRLVGGAPAPGAPGG
ncbi:MAG: mechanosensitive ion channel [Burkholderiales bacterium]|nr:mechanosensitive ion channel [Burkholderiales bacterium]GIK86388.1 MAG: mechanosensitive ion channel protein [Betaproteobacteria bacterium]